MIDAKIGPAIASTAITLEESLHAAQAHLWNADLNDAIKAATANKIYLST